MRNPELPFSTAALPSRSTFIAKSNQRIMEKTIQPKSDIASESQLTLATRLAPEDICPKDLVAVLNQVYELPSFLWSCSSTLLTNDEPVRLCLMSRDPGKPFKVRAVCLPFVYAVDCGGKQVAFDVRQHQLVRLDSKVGKKVWKRMRKSQKSL